MADILLPEPGRPYVLVTASGAAGLLDVAAEQITDLYTAHGALLLRGFATDLDAFRRFTDQFCATSVFNESPDRQLLDPAHNIQSVNGGAAAFPLHPELSREPWKPDVCFFACLNPPRAGGETTLCDGVELVRALPADVREGLAARRLLYIQPASDAVLAYWLGTATPDATLLAAPPPGCPYGFYRLPDGRVVRAFTRPALHKPMFTREPAFGNFLLFARYFLGRTGFPALDNGSAVPESWLAAAKAAGDRLAVAVAWQRGDVLMLDNSRFMHGRNAILDTDERLIASCFGYLRFAIPDADEPSDPPWRRAMFRPPQSGQPQPGITVQT